MFFTDSVPQHFVLHYFIIHVSDWLAGDDSDWFIDWLIACEWAGLSVSASQVTPDFWHPLGVCHCQLCADLIYWLTLENEHWLRLRLANEAHHFFVLIEWRHLILFGKWQQTDKNESIVIVMVQWSLCPHLTSNRVHSLTAFNQCKSWLKSHTTFILQGRFSIWLND